MITPYASSIISLPYQIIDMTPIIIIAVYMAANTSSAIMPIPPGNRSILRMPSGLNISKKRNKANDKIIVHHGATVVPPQSGNIDINWPTVSSTQATTGSLPQYFSDTLLAHVPAIRKKSVANTVIVYAGMPGHHIYSGNHRSIATIAPHVPGAIGKKPAPNDVAINFGNRGNFSSVIGIGLLDFILHIFSAPFSLPLPIYP